VVKAITEAVDGFREGMRTCTATWMRRYTSATMPLRPDRSRELQF